MVCNCHQIMVAVLCCRGALLLVLLIGLVGFLSRMFNVNHEVTRGSFNRMSWFISSKPKFPVWLLDISSYWTQCIALIVEIFCGTQKQNFHEKIVQIHLVIPNSRDIYMNCHNNKQHHVSEKVA